MKYFAATLLVAIIAISAVSETTDEVTFDLTWQDLIYVRLSHYDDKVLIELEMNEDATKRFSDMTRDNIGHYAIMQFNGHFVNRALIRSHILGGNMIMERDSIQDALEIISLLGKDHEQGTNVVEQSNGGDA